MADNIIKLTALPLEADSWSPFGWLPLSDLDSRDGVDTLDFAWADPHVNFIRHTSDEVDHIGSALVCGRLFRHTSHTQALLVIDHECVIAVAPPGARFDVDDDLGQVAAFTLRAGDALVLRRGTWHWGPFPTSSLIVNLYNVQGRRYVEDNESVELSLVGPTLAVSAPLR